MHAMYEVFGLLEDPSEVEATVHDLRVHGVPEEQMQVLEPAPGRYALADETLHREALGAGRMAVVGALVGMAIGLMAAWVIPSLGQAGPAVWSLAAFFAAVMGAVVGGMAGLQGADHQDDDEAAVREIPPSSPGRIIAVRSDRRHLVAHRVLEAHHAVFLDQLTPQT